MSRVTVRRSTAAEKKSGDVGSVSLPSVPTSSVCSWLPCWNASLVVWSRMNRCLPDESKENWNASAVVAPTVLAEADDPSAKAGPPR